MGVALGPPHPWTPLMPCGHQADGGNSGSYMILMKGDAWQACILSLHLGTRGGAGGALVPGASLPLASCAHQGCLSV